MASKAKKGGAANKKPATDKAQPIASEPKVEPNPVIDEQPASTTPSEPSVEPTPAENSCNKENCKSYKKCDVYENCNHYKVANYRNSYMWAVGITSVLIIAMTFVLCYRFSSTQDAIKQLQIETHNSSKDVFKSIYSKLEQSPVNCDSLISIVSTNPELATQIKNYDEVKGIIIGLANNLAYKELADELKKDSLLINRQIADNLNSTNALLEMQFNRIQNEYETLALWAGILTIVFLIFSFYSMFKTDDMLRQGKEGLNILKDEETKIINDLHDKQENYKQVSDSRLSAVLNKVEQINNTLDAAMQSLESRIAALELRKQTIETVFDQANSNAEKLQKTVTSLGKKEEDAEKIITKLNGLVEKFEQKLKELGGQKQ